MLKTKTALFFISLIAILRVFGQASHQELAWDEQEEISFNIFNQKLDEVYNEVYGAIKELVKDHKEMIKALVELNPNIAIVYTISLGELVDR